MTNVPLVVYDKYGQRKVIGTAEVGGLFHIVQIGSAVRATRGNTHSQAYYPKGIKVSKTNRKLLAAFAIVSAILVALLIWMAGPANSTPGNTSGKFVPYDVTVSWYKQGGNVSTNDIWPQNTTVIACGGIKQTDTYHIKTKKMFDDYTALRHAGVLNGPQDDAEFAPNPYTIVQLPDCLHEVPVPAEPTVNPATCDHSGSFTVPANTDSVKWLVDSAQINGGTGGDISTPGDHVISAHTTYGNQFPGGDHSVSWTITVPAQLSGDECVTDTPTPTPTTETPTPTSTPTTSSVASPSTSSSSSKPPATKTTSSSNPVVSPSSSIGPPVHKERLVSNNHPLANTGSHTGVLIVIAVLCLLFGGLLILAGSRKSSKKS